MEKLHSGPAGSARKRKRRERVFRFESFCEPGYPVDFRGSFLENVKALVGFGYPEASAGGGDGGVQCCSFNLELHHYPSSYLRLFVAEETVGMSLYRQCHYCRSVGWGHHMICNKRFHFVLPCKGSTPQMEDLSICVSSKYCQNAVRGTKTVDTRHHLLHGVVHSNGFGHLIHINGIGGGSEFVSGHRILDLWDRICTVLQMRKVSVTDVAKKGSMELRLIHGLAYGQSWFGRWGYKFGHGSYGVTLQMYQTSIDALRGLPLSLLVPHFAFSGRDIPMIVAKYQTVSGHALSTLSDLIRFMLELDRRLPQSSPVALDFNGIISEATCRWSMKRVEMAAQVIVEALKKSESRWVTRQDVRDAARAYIGDTGLLDYVLKSLGNHIVGDYIVRRMVNPVTKVLEYRLQDISSMFPRFERLGSVRLQVTRVQLAKDFLYLYKHVLREQSALSAATGAFAAVPMAVRVVLDTKHLVKDYKGGGGGGPRREIGVGSNEHAKLTCTVRVMGEHERKGLLPHETIIAPAGTTVGDLKREVEKRFKETYLGLKSFVAESVAGVKEEGSEVGLGAIELGDVVVVEGRVVGNGDGGEEIYEDGSGVSTIIDCVCGAKEEDGERMVCCDICEVWQHSRCARIVDDDDDEVGEEGGPRVFVCSRCENGILALPSIHYLD